MCWTIFNSLSPLSTTPDKIRKLETLEVEKKGADITHPLFRELEHRVSEALLQSDLLMDNRWQRSTNK